MKPEKIAIGDSFFKPWPLFSTAIVKKAGLETGKSSFISKFLSIIYIL
jgi:hypothetical protein